MIIVSLVYEVIDLNCDNCGEYFISVIETDMIDWDGNIEIRYVEMVECPFCMLKTKVTRWKN